MKLSRFGQLMAQTSPIVQLMEDLGEALNINPDLLFLGGGNPAQIPEAQTCFNKHIQAWQQDSGVFNTVIGVYQSPQGNETVLENLAAYYRKECGWDVDAGNIALVNGSQTAFFLLFNLFSGQASEAVKRKVLLPMAPEYLGYASQGMSGEQFQIERPLLELHDQHRFKYRINFDALDVHKDIGAICVSRPTNPSGNVLSMSELDQLSTLAEQANIPFIIDLAYGKPFPGLTYHSPAPNWSENIVAVMSMSKLGLPGVRTSVIVASEEIIQLVVRANTIMSLASGNLGPELLNRLIESGDLERMSQQVLPTFYSSKRDRMLALLDEHLAGTHYRIHEPEGAFFVWLWLEGLPVTSQELYQRLKQKGVLVMAGEPFFFGLDKEWSHARECLRLSYCQADEVLEAAVKLIAEELVTIGHGSASNPVVASQV